MEKLLFGLCMRVLPCQDVIGEGRMLVGRHVGYASAGEGEAGVIRVDDFRK
jgi:hypothetical protein